MKHSLSAPSARAFLAGGGGAGLGLAGADAGEGRA